MEKEDGILGKPTSKGTVYVRGFQGCFGILGIGRGTEERSPAGQLLPTPWLIPNTTLTPKDAAQRSEALALTVSVLESSQASVVAYSFSLSSCLTNCFSKDSFLQ